MVDTSGVLNYLESVGLNADGIAYVINARNSNPSRAVGEGGFSNVTSFVFSEKMKHTLQAESRGGEEAAIYEYHLDENVLEIWDQPPSVWLDGPTKNGKRGRWTSTPDYLVLRNTGVFIEEIKDDKFVKQKVDSNHPAWIIDDNNQAHYLPAEDYFKRMGIVFRVRLSSEFGKIKTENRKLILSSRREGAINEQLFQQVFKLLNIQSLMSLSDLRAELGLESFGPLVQLIDAKKIFGDLDNTLLSCPKEFYVGIDEKLVSFQLKDHSFGDVPLSAVPTKPIADEALRRLELIESGVSSRSSRRWKKSILIGKEMGLGAYESLFPKYQNCGNRQPRLAPEVLSTFDRAVAEYYANPNRSNVKSTYSRYLYLAEVEHPNHAPMSEKTFRKRLELVKAEQSYARGGKRFRNASAATSNVLDRNLRAQIAFQRAHMDHHSCDIYLRWGRDDFKDYIGSPWLSLLLDESTDSVLAYYFSFAPPSTVANACVIRRCVKIHRKLPEEILSDHGSDFKSVYYRSLLASVKVTHSLRPKSYPQFGSSIEGIFGAFKTEWLSQRPGNRADKVSSRAVDGKYSARNKAELTLEELVSEFDLYIKWREGKLRGINHESSSDSFHSDQHAFPFVGRDVEYNNEFLVKTAVDVRGFKLAGNLIEVDDLKYSNLELRKLNDVKSKTVVRVEPENPYIVYALVGAKWISCMAAGYREFKAKGLNAQMVETLRIRGAGALRYQAKNSADKARGKILNVADKRLHSRVENSISSYAESSDDNVKNVFKKARQTMLKDLATNSGNKSDAK